MISVKYLYFQQSHPSLLSPVLENTTVTTLTQATAPFTTTAITAVQNTLVVPTATVDGPGSSSVLKKLEIQLFLVLPL